MNTYLVAKHLTATAYNLQTKDHSKQWKNALIKRLRHYLEYLQRDWDTYVERLTYGYKN